jgi:hypothetical protein
MIQHVDASLFDASWDYLEYLNSFLKIHRVWTSFELAEDIKAGLKYRFGNFIDTFISSNYVWKYVL